MGDLSRNTPKIIFLTNETHQATFQKHAWRDFNKHQLIIMMILARIGLGGKTKLPTNERRGVLGWTNEVECTSEGFPTKLGREGED